VVEMQSTSMSRSASGRVPDAAALLRQETDERALVAAAMLLTAAGYRVDPMPPARPHVDLQGVLPVLTMRERQVASLLVEGASNKLIARRLEISVHTAKFHVAAVLEKLGARNRSDAVAIALRDGLVAL
jgi:DNA-binding CsgD family transcriptional regulator